MRRTGVAAALVVIVVAAAACGASDAATAPPAGPANDAGPDGPGRPRPKPDGALAGEGCSERSPFVDLARIDPLSSDRNEGRVSLTEDELTLVFQRQEPGGTTIILITTRAVVDEPFPAPVEVDAVKTIAGNVGVAAPAIAPDGLRLVVTATVDTKQQLWLLERTSRTEPFGAPKRALNELNEGVFNAAASFSRDGQRLYFSSSRGFATPSSFESNHIFVAEGTGTFAPPTAVIDDATDSELVGVEPIVSADDRTLYFSRITPTGFRIFVAELEGGRAKNIALVEVPSVADAGPNQVMGAISGDHCRLYFAATTNNATFDVFLARR